MKRLPAPRAARRVSKTRCRRLLFQWLPTLAAPETAQNATDARAPGSSCGQSLPTKRRAEPKALPSPTANYQASGKSGEANCPCNANERRRKHEATSHRLRKAPATSLIGLLRIKANNAGLKPGECRGLAQQRESQHHRIITIGFCRQKP